MIELAKGLSYILWRYNRHNACCKIGAPHRIVSAIVFYRAETCHRNPQIVR
mgnify:FL=1